MSTKRLIDQRRRLWLKNPHCFYCGKETVLPEDIPLKTKRGLLPTLNPQGKRANFPHYMATLEHIRSKLHPERTTSNPTNKDWKPRHVIACHECNQKVNDVELHNAPKEMLWKLSGRSPNGGQHG